jgi:hypothetical protein
MKDSTEKMLSKATKAQLTEALLSACQELAFEKLGWQINMGGKYGYVAAGSLNNQILKHLKFPDSIIDD